MSFQSNSGQQSVQNEVAEQNFQVYVRLRPMQKIVHQPYGIGLNRLHEFKPIHQEQSLNNQQSVIKLDSDGCTLYALDLEYKNIEKSYYFNGVLDDKQNNERAFQNTVQPTIENVLQGINATFFAYGITGSGKTHTIFGNDIDHGICIRAMDYLLQQAKVQEIESKYTFSFLEIYNENVRDLFREDLKNLTIIEDPIRGVVVQDLKEYTIVNIQQIKELVTLGNQKRAMASTAANQYSSRSHAILILNCETKDKQTNNSYTSKLTFIDLAGSEKVTADKQQKGIIEGSNINKSLLALGNCINSLADVKRKSTTFIPYRDSKLTRLLKDTLGGNTKTVMIACISQSYSCYDETINTLNYAQRATNIKKKITKNLRESSDFQQADKYKEIIKNLKLELEQLYKIQTIECQKCGFVKENNIDLRDLGEKVGILSSIKIGEDDEFTEDEKNEQNERIIKEIEAVFKAKIDKIEEEKKEIQEQILGFTKMLSDEKQDREQFYIERICCDIIANIEEKYEINYNLRDLEQNLQQNYQRLEILDQAQQQCKNSIVQSDMEELLVTIKENEQIKNRMMQALEVNATQKDILKELLLKMKNEKNNFELDAQIKIRKQQQECLELLQQNHEVMQELHIYKKKTEEKLKQKKQVENELNKTKTLLNNKEQIIVDLNLKIRELQMNPINMTDSIIMNPPKEGSNRSNSNSLSRISKKQLFFKTQASPATHYRNNSKNNSLNSKNPQNMQSSQNFTHNNYASLNKNQNRTDKSPVTNKSIVLSQRFSPSRTKQELLAQHYLNKGNSLINSKVQENSILRNNKSPRISQKSKSGQMDDISDKIGYPSSKSLSFKQDLRNFQKQQEPQVTTIELFQKNQNFMKKNNDLNSSKSNESSYLKQSSNPSSRNASNSDQLRGNKKFYLNPFSFLEAKKSSGRYQNYNKSEDEQNLNIIRSQLTYNLQNQNSNQHPNIGSNSNLNLDLYQKNIDRQQKISILSPQESIIQNTVYNVHTNTFSNASKEYQVEKVFDKNTENLYKQGQEKTPTNQEKSSQLKSNIKKNAYFQDSTSKNPLETESDWDNQKATSFSFKGSPQQLEQSEKSVFSQTTFGEKNSAYSNNKYQNILISDT